MKQKDFVEGWKDRFENEFRREGHMLTLRDGEILHPIDEVTDFIRKVEAQAYAQGEQDMLERTRKQVGLMRQWLNEDRITDPSKIVTNEELLVWLNKAPDKDDRTRIWEAIVAKRKYWDMGIGLENKLKEIIFNKEA